MIISVDGNIGSGKSTALACVSDLYATFQEPVDRWTLLEKFYADRAAYALPFQLEVLESYADVPARACANDVLITERSPLTSREVFGKLLVNDGVMTDVQWDVYNAWYRTLGWAPDGIVYIHAPPAVCLERVERRGRASELAGGVDLGYLERLDRAHRVLAVHAGVPVEIVDGTRPRDEVVRTVRAAVQKLANDHFTSSAAASDGRGGTARATAA